MNELRRRTPSELLKRGYSDEELRHIYELGRFHLENGDLRRGELIMLGISEIAPDFAAAWLALSYIHLQNKNLDSALVAARRAQKANPDLIEALLFLVVCLMEQADLNAAGTFLGEIGEKIEMGLTDNQNVIRLYRAQLARYQTR